jgi:L-threonylcarbamoyladenylate synthase
VITELTTSPEDAAKFIKRGGLVGFPTETVYGLGADVFNETAVAKIFEAKRRPADNPLIAHIATHEQIERLAANVSSSATMLIEAFFPGPLTLVFAKRDEVSNIATAGLDTIGVRMPSLQTANEFLLECRTPVVAPSANLSGKPSPTTWQAVFEDLEGRIDCILQGDPTEIGLESTVVDCVAAIPVVLRKGAVPLERLREIIPEIRTRDSIETDDRRSPGLRHQHYSPRADVVLVDRDEEYSPSDSDAFIGLTQREESFALKMVCRSVEDYAVKLFEFFRECDRRSIERIFCETVTEAGLGAALMDRLRRAAKK